LTEPSSGGEKRFPQGGNDGERRKQEERQGLTDESDLEHRLRALVAVAEKGRHDTRSVVRVDGRGLVDLDAAGEFLGDAGDVGGGEGFACLRGKEEKQREAVETRIRMKRYERREKQKGEREDEYWRSFSSIRERARRSVEGGRGNVIDRDETNLS
jgi:hypothetical protein